VPSLVDTAAAAPDGTIWLLAQPRQLLRAGVKKGVLTTLEKWEAPVSNSDELWCDKAGRVWRFSNGSYRSGQLACYAVGASP